MKPLRNLLLFVASLLAFTSDPSLSLGQGFDMRPFQVVSPELSTDLKITFRLFAPKAEAVRLMSNDIPEMGQGTPMTKGTNGVWEVALGPVRPGAYRYGFDVDGVAVIDPRNPLTSQAHERSWSLFPVSGSDFMDTKPVPHGAVSVITYYSKTLSAVRRLHVYTPPGYESGKGKFPVFYLLHGSSDCDDSWSSVGRAGFILDNLIAAKKAKPMVIIMPAGHTTSGWLANDDDSFERDFVNDIMPLVQENYRVYNDRKHRAIAGLSMGGGQTLTISMAHLDQFAYIGVFSAGVFGIAGGFDADKVTPSPTWEEKKLASLDNAKLKKGLKLVWFATGKDDFLVKTTHATIAMLKKHDFDVIYNESAGGHTWINWRDYLNEFAPLLFQ